MHEGCTKFVWPKSNEEYWTKLMRNKARDERIRSSEKLGWKVLIGLGM